MEHIWTILMLKILHAHLLRTFVANSKIDAIYTLYPESLSDKYLESFRFFWLWRRLIIFFEHNSFILIGIWHSTSICVQFTWFAKSKKTHKIKRINLSRFIYLLCFGFSTQLRRVRKWKTQVSSECLSVTLKQITTLVEPLYPLPANFGKDGSLDPGFPFQ